MQSARYTRDSFPNSASDWSQETAARMLGSEGARTHLGVALALGHKGFTPVRAGHANYIFHYARIWGARLPLHY